MVSSYIERIKEIQPILNCVVSERFEEALEEAKKCDELLKSKDAPSVEFLAKEKPLFGIPFTTKVIFGSYFIHSLVLLGVINRLDNGYVFAFYRLLSKLYDYNLRIPFVLLHCRTVSRSKTCSKLLV